MLIDTPRARGYYGGPVAAPVFKRIAEASLRHMGIGPTINAPSPVLAAQYAIDGSAFLPRAAFEGEVVGAALPSPEAGVMPDLRGRSAREALRTLTRIGATARVLGQGFVVEQSPRAGEPLDPGEVALLVLDRRIADARSGTP